MAAKKGTWIGGTVFAAAVIGAATWFGVVSPTLSAAAGLRAQTDQVNQSNDVLQTKVQKLAAEYKKLPDYKQQLDTLRIQVPTTAQLSDYVRQVQQVATAHSVVVTTINPGAAKAVTLAQSAAPAPASTPTDTASPTDTSTPAPTATSATDATGTGTTSAPAASGVPVGMAAIPMSFTVVGTYDNTLAFLSDVQTATARLFLVTGIQGTSQKDAQASSGRPATKVGDQELVVTGFLYVLPDPTAVAPTPAPTTTAPALPAPVPGKNPLVPVAGK
jgi:Tfp pilus assembly protein PilO